MPETDTRSVAARCLQAWTTGDFATTRALMDDDVTFTGPLGHTEGIEAYMSGIQGFAQVVKGADQHQVFGEDGNVCIIYDLVTTTPAGTIPTAGWYQVRGGKITAVRVFFDARPFESG